jgi:hypothetical protein
MRQVVNLSRNAINFRVKSTDSMSKGGELNNAEMPLPSHALTAKFGLRKPD